jgi:23S rRNA (cytosine1962-C5)-methyltransferase
VNVSGNVLLKPGRDKNLRQFHPWVFSGAIDEARSSLTSVPPGGLVDVRDSGGEFVARGYYSPHSQIRVRALTWDQNDAIGPAWWRVRIAHAVAARSALAGRTDVTAYRLVNAESDGLPGLIVDRYGGYLVIQALTGGVEVVKQGIVAALVDLLTPAGIYERSDVDARQKEGLPESTGILWGESPPNPLEMVEFGVRYPVDVYAGHKTGFYLDQRESRHWLLDCPDLSGADVLNAFSYTGSFGVCAALRGARQVVNVESSAPALEAARQAMALNGLDQVTTEYVGADVFQQLRVYRDEGREFDVVILDPPKFAHSQAQLERALRGYKDINLLAFQILRPGGLLVTFSCSGLVYPDLFQKVVFGASVDAERQAQVVAWLGQPDDHPVLLSFPEGRYLKGLVCRASRV